MKGFLKGYFLILVSSPLLCWLTDDLTGLNIGSPPPGTGEQDHAAAVEVMEVLPFLLAAMLASMIEASLSPSLLQPVQPGLGAAEQGVFRSTPALP